MIAEKIISKQETSFEFNNMSGFALKKHCHQQQKTNSILEG